MNEYAQTDAREIRAAIRNLEATINEAQIAVAELEQKMLAARRNPDVPVGTGQQLFLRTGKLRSDLVSAGNNALRVHDGLNNVYREMAGVPEPDTETPFGLLSGVDEQQTPLSVAA